MIGIIIGSSISLLDLVINSFSLCMSGKCQVECCGNSFKHSDTEQELIEEIKEVRRMSGPPPPPKEPISELPFPSK